MTAERNTAHLIPRALLAESEDLLAAPHVAEQAQLHDLTYSDYLKYLVDDLARGQDRSDWTRQIAKEGDIALARRLAASCGSPDLDRFVESQREDWLQHCQDQLEQSQQAHQKTPMPLSGEDEQRINHLREEASAQMRDDHFQLAQRTLKLLTGELSQMLQYAAQFSKNAATRPSNACAPPASAIMNWSSRTTPAKSASISTNCCAWPSAWRCTPR